MKIVIEKRDFKYIGPLIKEKLEQGFPYIEFSVNHIDRISMARIIDWCEDENNGSLTLNFPHQCFKDG